VAKEDKKAEKDEEKEEKESAHKEESESEEGGEGEGGKKKLSKKMLIILAAVGVLVMGGGTVGALFLTGVLGGHNKEEAVEHKEGELKGAAVFFPLGDILVNLNGEGKRPNFLKIKVTLELADEKDVPLMTSLKPRIIDNFQVYLRELRIEDLRGSAGLYRLREELLLRVTEAAQPVRVRDVLFQEILVQ
jgi:flagellar protein FliL